ncbi:hypothetical protein ASG92_25365 [Arthrobacter sp. Soil736]|uniref:hypothetical protein n=1 Tax=Arthrobacter sp. Soil736 TaxID=1736395 RepID=UPI0006F5F051|nr:hypothetical protein [Arthrobacter sp. Soil736]KRE52383.1 hypothetical protein ASG92_25365 [Arthrobacter sp. Soil736]
MNVSMQDVLKVLEPEEPRYSEAAALGPESLPHLRALVEGDDAMLASKAAYAAGLLEGGQDVVLAAAHSDEAIIRAAAAGAARNLPAESAVAVLADLVGDTDAGVRKVARSAIPENAPQELIERVEAAARWEDGPTPPREQPGAGLMPGETQVPGRMPGEEAPRDDQGAAGLMPGEEPPVKDQRGTGLMPGEEAPRDDQGAAGLMPGEELPVKDQGATGLMPGETR